MPKTFFGKSRSRLVLEQFYEAHDMTQRRAQIVGNGITERVQFRVGDFQILVGGDISSRRDRSAAAVWHGNDGHKQERHDTQRLRATVAALP